MLSFDGKYTVYRADRDDSGGGVALLIDSSLPSSLAFSQSFSPYCQTLGIIAHFHSNKFLVCIIYRSPSCNPSDFANCLSFIHDYACSHPLPFLLFGDLNCPDVNWNNLSSSISNPSHHSNVLLEFTRTLSLSQCVDKPTRGNNILDIVLTSHPHLINNCRVLPPLPKLDHSLVVFKLDVFVPRIQPKLIRDYKNVDWERVRSQIASIDWDSLLAQVDQTPDTIYSTFLEHIYPILDQNVPYRKLTKAHSGLSSKSKRLLRKSNSLFHRRFSIGLLPYQNASSLFRKSVRLSRRKRERDLISRPNSKRFFQFASDRLKDNCSSIPTLIDSQGSHLINDQSKADLLASHFSQCFNNSAYPPPSLPHPTRQASIDYVAFSPMIIQEILSKIPNRNSTSPDGIPYIFIKNTRDQICRPLSTLFNSFMLHSDIPAIWKTAIVRPIYKRKGNRHCPENYRPISLTCSLSKIMERVVCTELSLFMSRNNLFPDQQHGFRAKRSCTTALLTTFSHWHASLDRKKYVTCAFIDFSKAFDSLPLDLLVWKCESIGIRGCLIRWIRSFLSNRTQSVTVGNCMSSPFPVLSGVPQGSCLGPLLFSIYIADVISILPPGTHCSMYADDLKIYSINSVPLLQSAIDKLVEWSTQWGLTLSPSKSVVMLLGANHPACKITALGNDLPIKNQIKDLGVSYSNKLCFSSHLDEIIGKASARCSFIHRSFQSRSPALYAKLFTTYVRPLLEFCCELWNPCTITNVSRIEKVQRRFTRIVYLRCGLPPTPYSNRLMNLDLPTLSDRRIRFDLLTCYKIIFGHFDVNSRTFFNFSRRIGTSRGNRLKLCPFVTTSDRFANFLSNRVVPLWNRLDDSTVSDRTPSIACNYIKTVLISQLV